MRSLDVTQSRKHGAHGENRTHYLAVTDVARQSC